MTQPAAPANPGIRRRSTDGILLGSGVDSGGEEEGGTPLTEFIEAAPPLDDTNTEDSRHDDDQPNKHDKVAEGTPFRLSRPRSILNANRILDWLLGRHVYSTPEDLASNAGSQRPKHKQDIDDDYFDIGDVQDICPACTTSYCQAIDSVPFKSSLKLIYNDPMSQQWLIGNKFVLHEGVDEHPDDEYVPLVEASRALKTLACNVPIPKVRAGWKENGKVITISDPVPGERLYDILWDLSHKEREHIAAQVAQHIEDWRGTDLGRISSLTGGPVYHHENLLGPNKEGFGPFGSDLELWQAIQGRLEKKGVPEATIQLLRDHMPSSSPCVFTHGDLSSTNITVHNGHVSAITGFENAASLPVWAEDVAMHFCSCAEDEHWKALLSKHTHTHTHRHQAALDWWSLWTAAEDAGRNGAERLSRLSTRYRRWDKTETILGHPFWSTPLDDASAKRLNIRTAENPAEARVAHLVRHAIASDGPREPGSYVDVSSDVSWECSAEDGHGLTPFHPAQREHHSLVTSANAPLRHPFDILGVGSRVRAARTGSRDSRRRSTAGVFLADAEDSGSDVESERHRADGSARTLVSKGLRPLSLPAFALSGSTRSQQAEQAGASMREEAGTQTLVSIREDEGAGRVRGEDVPVRAKRTSMFGSRGAPGELYARLSAASTEAWPRRHGRSRSEGRSWLGGGDDVRMDVSRRRPRSMLQPSVWRDGGEDGRGDEREE